MPAIKLRWSSLLHLTELEFIPEPPKVLSVSDELIQSLSWLTGATQHDRRLIRCDESGAILTADAWSLFTAVESAESYPEALDPKIVVATVANKGILAATSTEIVKLTFVRVEGGDTEEIYVPPNTLYWYPHPTYSITATVVPAGAGTASYVGLTAFN